MLFKTKQIEKDYKDFMSPYPSQQQKLHRLVNIIDDISLLLGFGDIMITDYLRQNPKSLHDVSYGLAVDIRVKDKLVDFYVTIVAILKQIESYDHKLRCQPHFEIYRKKSQHIHVEVRLR